MMKINLLMIISLVSTICYTQNLLIKGNIKKNDNQAISNVNIVLLNNKNEIISYTYSDSEGNYTLKTEKIGKFNLTFSSLGYENKTVVVKIDRINKETTVNVVLREKSFDLNEVIIQTELPMSIKKDTISFKTKFYVQGNEQTVEDLLKKIPGLNIDIEGTIKVGNQEIEKLMIDGDDLFEKGYKILSKNMPAFPIEEIEILKNYSNNRLLKNIEESNKVALNLKLKEKSKRIWFGNAELGYGINNFYDYKSNIMNFGKKNKFYFLTILNNIGNNVTEDINQLVRPFQLNKLASIGDNQQAEKLINLSSIYINFKKNRTNFNKAKLFSLNAIFNPTKKLKIKTVSFLDLDNQDFFRNSVENVTANETNFSNTEDYKLINKKFIVFGKIDLTYNISKTKILTSSTKFNSENKDSQSNLIFNTTSTVENLQSINTFFDQKISYSNKFKKKKVFLLTGRFIDDKTPQTYSINQFLYQELFPNYTNANNVQQQTKNQMQFRGFEAILFDRKTNNDLLELQFGNEFRKDLLSTTFTLFENSETLETPNGFQNNTIYQTNDLYFITKYNHKIKNIAVTGKFGFHQLFNRLYFSDYSKNQNPFFVNPSISIDWKLNNKNKITSSYSYKTTNAKILDIYNDYVLTGFRSFSKGIGTFNQLNTSTLILNYQLGNWSDRFFANTFVFYNKNFDFFSSNTSINKNFTQTERIVIKDRELSSISSKFDYFIKKISSNLKLDIGYSKSNYKNIINNSNLREIKSNNYNYGLELRSGFKGAFNYYIGTKWNTNKITSTINKTFTNNVSFLDLSIVFNEKFNIQFQTERYFFGNLDKSNNTYYFLDFDARYTVKKNKLTLALTGKNLFNTETFKTFSISDISTSTTEYKLLERFVLLKMEYRF